MKEKIKYLEETLGAHLYIQMRSKLRSQLRNRTCALTKRRELSAPGRGRMR
jgi:hypothetical protein